MLAARHAIVKAEEIAFGVNKIILAELPRIQAIAWSVMEEPAHAIKIPTAFRANNKMDVVGAAEVELV